MTRLEVVFAAGAIEAPRPQENGSAGRLPRISRVAASP